MCASVSGLAWLMLVMAQARSKLMLVRSRVFVFFVSILSVYLVADVARPVAERPLRNDAFRFRAKMFLHDTAAPSRPGLVPIVLIWMEQKRRGPTFVPGREIGDVTIPDKIIPVPSLGEMIRDY